MTDTPQQKPFRILRALARDGDIMVVTRDPSPDLEAALRDVVTALLLKLKFKNPGRPFTFNQLTFYDAVNRCWIDEDMTKEDALLRAGQECNVPLGNVKTRKAKLARLEKHYATAEGVKAGERVLEFCVEADMTRKGAQELARGQADLARGWAQLHEAERKLDARERAFRREQSAETVRKGQL